MKRQPKEKWIIKDGRQIEPKEKMNNKRWPIDQMNKKR